MEECIHGPREPTEIEDLDTFDWCSYCDHSEERYYHLCCNIEDCDYFKWMIADSSGCVPVGMKRDL